MRRVGGMRVRPSMKSIREEEYREKVIKEYKKKLDVAYERAKEGIVEWIGEEEVLERFKEKDEDGDYLVYLIQIKRIEKEGEESTPYYTLSVSYDKRPIFEMSCKMREMRRWVKEEKYKTCVIMMKDKDLRRILEKTPIGEY